MDMLIHRIMQLHYKGVNPIKKIEGNTGEKDLAEEMKRDYGLVKRLRGYSILSIQD